MKKLFTIVAMVAMVAFLASPVYALDYQLSTSKNLTGAAWAGLTGGTYTAADDTAFTVDYTGATNAEKIAAAKEWASICSFFYKPRALAQSTAADTHFSNHADGTTTIESLYSDCWAYCDVAICYFIKGEAFRKEADKTNADLCYDEIIAGATFPSGLCAMLKTSDGTAIDASTTIDVGTFKIQEAAADRKALVNDGPSGYYDTY